MSEPSTITKPDRGISSAESAGRGTRWKTAAGFFLAFALGGAFLSCALQAVGGAYSAEWGGHPDEAAHYVTGRLIHDYVAAGFPGNPMRYAQDYYEHYPKVALGNWPPVFYLIQGAWMFVGGVGRSSMLLFMAGLTGLLSGVLGLWLRERFGWRAAAFGTATLLASPLVWEHLQMIMAEVPVTLFFWAALYFWARFLREARWQDSLGFALLACACILTKGSGIVLALIVPVSTLLARRWTWMRKTAFWLPVPVVALGCGPWMWKFREISKAGWAADGASWDYTREALGFFPWEIVVAAGPGWILLAGFGLWQELRNGGVRRLDIPAAVTLATLLCLPAFHILLPVGLEQRYLIPLLPALLWWVLNGCKGWFANSPETCPRRRNADSLTGAVLLLCLALSLAWEGLPMKQAWGFRPAAWVLLKTGLPTGSPILVSSGPRGEGQFISEMAMLETENPSHPWDSKTLSSFRILRSTKALSEAKWSGKDYRERFASPPEMLAELHRLGVGAVVQDRYVPEVYHRPDLDTLDRMIREYPERFRRIYTGPSRRFTGEKRDGIAVYLLQSSSE